MLFLFGTRTIGFTKAKGIFHCPNCQVDREYKLKNYKRFFTLFFVPIFPVQNYGEGVECQTCKKKYEPNSTIHFN